MIGKNVKLNSKRMFWIPVSYRLFSLQSAVLIFSIFERRLKYKFALLKMS